MKFLMISNSFGVNLQTYATDIAKANNEDLDIYVLYIGGCSLYTHYNNILSGEKAYELYHNGTSTHEFISIQDALAMDKWDVISLQQASHECGMIETYYPYFENVYNFVKKNAPESKLIFHKTWAYSSINNFKYETVKEYAPTFRFENANQMKKAIDDCYNQISSEFKLDGVIRSGDVVELAMGQIGDCYDGQGFHMNNIGCYLIGCNLIKFLFNKPLTNVYVPANLGKGICEKMVKFINDRF